MFLILLCFHDLERFSLALEIHDCFHLGCVVQVVGYKDHKLIRTEAKHGSFHNFLCDFGIKRA